METPRYWSFFISLYIYWLEHRCRCRWRRPGTGLFSFHYIYIDFSTVVAVGGDAQVLVFFHSIIYILTLALLSLSVETPRYWSFFISLYICDPSREKGRVGCHIVIFTFSTFWIENFMTNQEILTCWWVLDHFGSQNVQRRWVLPWSVPNFLLTLL